MSVSSLTSRFILSASLIVLGTSGALAAPAQSAAADKDMSHAQASPLSGPDTLSVAADTAAARYQSVLDRRLKTNVDGIALFDYASAKNAGELATIRAFITDESARKPSQMNTDAATVYWANLYNAVTLAVVLENYPVKSIREIKSGFRAGPWKRDLVTVEGEELSLDNIEHDILRKDYASPFIHYMVNCASIGCPNLHNKLWSVDTYKAEREMAAKAYLATNRGVKLDKDGDLIVSSIYDWFGKDFGGKKGVLTHIKLYGPANVQAAITNGAKIDDDDYDWSLNQ